MSGSEPTIMMWHNVIGVVHVFCCVGDDINHAIAKVDVCSDLLYHDPAIFDKKNTLIKRLIHRFNISQIWSLLNRCISFPIDVFFLSKMAGANKAKIHRTNTSINTAILRPGNGSKNQIQRFFRVSFYCCICNLSANTAPNNYHYHFRYCMYGLYLGIVEPLVELLERKWEPQGWYHMLAPKYYSRFRSTSTVLFYDLCDYSISI